MTNSMKKASFLTCVVILGACGDPIKFGQDLDEERVLGVRVESERGFASAQAGDELTVEVLVAGPGGPVETKVALEVCEATDAARGVLFCKGEEYVSAELEASSTPTLALTVPDEARDEQPLSVLGVACTKGTPQLADDPLNWGCSNEDARALRFSFDAWVRQEPENQNPDLSELRVTLDEQELDLAPVSSDAECEGDVEVEAKATLELAFSLGDEARQVELGESLQLSHFSNLGRYERQFTIIDPPPESSDFSIEWKSPSEPGAVKHYLVVRDDAGGTSWVSFGLCVR